MTQIHRMPEEGLAGGSGSPRRIGWLEPLGWAGLAGLAAFYVATSWRKWPDSLVDFGRELYVPWRLANGAVLYRDVDDYYGPLSQYINAGLFRLFGPGLMVLVAANLLVFIAITVAIYLLFRRAWGAGAAWASTAIFIAVFGFSQFAVMGNFNYATPYAHEATHGFLACLLLVVVLVRWIEKATPWRSFVAGGLLGLTAVLKPEIMLAAGLVTGAAYLLKRRHSGPPGAGDVLAWAGGAILPTAGFALFFATHVSWAEALVFSSRAWLSVASTTRFTGDFIQMQFLGFDRPWPHLLGHVVATLLAVLLVGGLCGLARLADRPAFRAGSALLLGCSVVGVAWLALAWIDWAYVGPCLLGLTLIYLAPRVLAAARDRAGDGHATTDNLRLLIGVLAAALMARMVLNGRIYEFGFYQAALAGLLVPAVLIGELPGRLGLDRRGRRLFVAASTVLLGCGTWQLTVRSQGLLQSKVFSLGSGRDQFYAFDPELNPISQVIGFLCDRLRQYPPGGTLLVLPEGEMINYLTRRPCPVAPFFFFSAATSGGREDEIVRRLQQHPPDLVVVLSRDLRGYGVARYGGRPGEGLHLMRWVVSNYRVAWHIGGDPLDVREVGGLILKPGPRIELPSLWTP